MKEFICSDDRPLIPDGKYEAQCFAYDNKFCLGKTRKTFLKFVILDQGEHFEKKIFMAFNMPYDKKIRPGSKYYKTWVKVNGWSRPSRSESRSQRPDPPDDNIVKNRVRPPGNRRAVPYSGALFPFLDGGGARPYD